VGKLDPASVAPIAVNTTAMNGVPLRFVSGSARQYADATRPSAEVQSVPSFTAASKHANAEMPSIKKENQNQKSAT
jgi:hypothetical protein